MKFLGDSNVHLVYKFVKTFLRESPIKGRLGKVNLLSGCSLIFKWGIDMKRPLVVLIIASCVFFNSCVTEQKTIQQVTVPQERNDAPIWNVGDSWRFRYANMREGQISVERVEGNLYIVKDHHSMERYYFDKRTLNYQYSISPHGEKIKNETIFFYGIYCDFPVYIGKKWAKMVSGQYTDRSPTSYLHEFKVVSFENITVPAGTFNAYKIEFTRRTPERSASSIKRHFWYSPEAKNIIKHQYIPTMEASGWTTGVADFELVSLKLDDKQWPPPEEKLVPKELDTTTKPQAPLHEKGPEFKAVTPSPVINVIVVTGTSANIRSGAGNEFPSITIVKQGDKLILLGEYGEWFNVRLKNGQEGWINRKFAK